MKDNLIYKSNDIIHASYALTVAEQRLLLACISQIQSDDEIGVASEFTISVDEARDLFYSKKDARNAYKDLVRACERLFRREILMQSEDGNKEMLTRWVSTVKFDHSEKTASLCFHHEIKPYISQLKNNFTKYRLKHIAELSSVYSIRVYEMIVSWHGQNSSFQEMTVDEFRDCLDLGRKYKQFGQLREKVIKIAVDQINKSTNYKLEIVPKKCGTRAYTKLQFKFSQKAEDAKAEQEKFESNLLKRQSGKQKRLKAEEKAQQKKEWGKKQIYKTEFDAFAKDCHIENGMKFSSKTLKKDYTIEDMMIMSSDFKGNVDGVNGQTYFLDETLIKQLIFSGELKQVINNEDTKTGDLFNN